MTPKGVHERSHATPADKRHDDVDRIRRWDLGPELVPNSRLARCVGENSRVEEGREWTLDRACVSVRKTFQQRNQDARGVERFVSIEVGSSIGEGLKATNERRSYSYCLVAPFSFRRSVNRSRDDV